jgi:UDPglucose 6-dehydrogenase
MSASQAPWLLLTNIHSDELIKYASNAFLAVKISYANVLADLCERLRADVQEVTRAVGLDPRIRPSFLEAGLGFGGSRLPKDLRAFCRLTERTGVEAGILQAAEKVNRSRIDLFFDKVQRSLWILKDKRIGLLGLAHKANTDDIRGSPAIELFKRFTAAGAQVRAYDPRAMSQARSAYPDMTCGADALDVAEHADALVVATDGKSLSDWIGDASTMLWRAQRYSMVATFCLLLAWRTWGLNITRWDGQTLDLLCHS